MPRKAKHTVITDGAIAKIRAGVTSIQCDDGITNMERLQILRELRDHMNGVMQEVAGIIREADARAAAPELFAGDKYQEEAYAPAK